MKINNPAPRAIVKGAYEKQSAQRDENERDNHHDRIGPGRDQEQRRQAHAQRGPARELPDRLCVGAGATYSMHLDEQILERQCIQTHARCVGGARPPAILAASDDSG